MLYFENGKQKMIAVEKIDIAGEKNPARNWNLLTIRRELRAPTIN